MSNFAVANRNSRSTTLSRFETDFTGSDTTVIGVFLPTRASVANFHA